MGGRDVLEFQRIASISDRRQLVELEAVRMQGGKRVVDRKSAYPARLTHGGYPATQCATGGSVGVARITHHQSIGLLGFLKHSMTPAYLSTLMTHVDRGIGSRKPTPHARSIARDMAVSCRMAMRMKSTRVIMSAPPETKSAAQNGQRSLKCEKPRTDLLRLFVFFTNTDFSRFA